jgi:pilus assembly protein Flp/PilA
MCKIARFVTDESGTTAIEYGLVAAGIAVAMMAVVSGIGTQLNAAFSGISTRMQ